jgi:hypothetical protein
MEEKPVTKKMIVIIAGVLVVITVAVAGIAYKAGTEAGKANINNFNYTNTIAIERVMENEVKEIQEGHLTVTLEDKIENYIGTGYIKVKSDKSGEVLIDAKDIQSSSKDKVLCQYVIKWHTYSLAQGKRDEDNGRIQDLGVKVLTDTENEFLIPIPEDININNDDLGIKVYLAVQEIKGAGFKIIDEIAIEAGQLNKPSSLQTFGKIYGDDGSGYITIEDYIEYAKEIKPLTPEEQDYRDYEITKYTSSNSLIDLETNEIVISKAVELRESSDSNEEFIDKVYKLIRSMEYDQELFDKNKETGRLYIPDINSKFEESKGICVDKSWMVALMLRSQGIPTKIVDGYQEFIGAHSWNEVLINGQWVHIDATNGHLYGMVNGYEPLRVS